MQPSMLLLDEPMAGMNAEEKEDMARYVLDVNELAGVTTVLVEHDMGVVMDISTRVTVLDFGRVIAEGTPAEVSGDPDGHHGIPGRRACDRGFAARVSADTTFPQLLRRLAAEHPDDHALREKRYGIWQATTWAQYEQRVRRFAQGLAALGFERGETIAVLGDNRPEWLIAELAAQSLGGTSLGLHRRQRRRGGRAPAHPGARALRRGRGPGAGRQARRAHGATAPPTPSSGSSTTTRAALPVTSSRICTSSPTSSAAATSVSRAGGSGR